MAGYKNFEVDRNKYKRMNVFDSVKGNKKTQTKSEKLMEGVDIWTSFYRANPHRFARDYLGINLKIFQAIIINMMMINHYFMYLASRGQVALSQRKLASNKSGQNR